MKSRKKRRWKDLEINTLFILTAFEKENKKNSDNSEYRNEFIVNEYGWIQKTVSGIHEQAWIMKIEKDKKIALEFGHVKRCENTVWKGTPTKHAKVKKILNEGSKKEFWKKYESERERSRWNAFASAKFLANFVDSSVDETVGLENYADRIEQLVGLDSVARFGVSQSSAFADCEFSVVGHVAETGCDVISKLGWFDPGAEIQS